MSAAKHTPLPWKLDRFGCPCIATDDAGYSAMRDSIVANGFALTNTDEAKANTALIVRAVNNHQKLVDALRDYVLADEFANGPAPENECPRLRNARALLAELEQS